MSFFKNLFNKILPSSTKTKEVVQNSSVIHQSDQNVSITVLEKKSSGLIDVLFSPIRAVTTAVSKVLDIFPDPSKTGTLYDGVNSTYNTIAQTIINVPSTVLGKIPVVSVVGDIASSILSAGFKAAGIVADHTIMLAANAVEVSKAALVGTVNIVDKNITGEAHVEFNGKNPETLDNLNEVISHSASYTINSLESHLVHDIDLIATIPDLLVDVTRDVEKNLNINIPGSDFLNSVLDSTVVNVRDNVIETVIGNAIKISEGLGLTYTDVGVMRHENMDHVGEGNIREGFEWHGSHGDNNQQDADHKHNIDQNQNVELKQNVGHEQHTGHDQNVELKQNVGHEQNTGHDQNVELKQNVGHEQNTGHDQNVELKQNVGHEQNTGHDQNVELKQNVGHEQNTGHDQNVELKQNVGHEQNTGHDQNADLKQNADHSQNNQSVCTCVSSNDQSSSNHNAHDHSHVTQYDLSVSKFLPDLNLTTQLY